MISFPKECETKTYELLVPNNYLFTIFTGLLSSNHGVHLGQAYLVARGRMA